ncbi:MAG: histidine--tRNA ligase [Candidatus Nomurabacteria bacterium]|jgi:histidyl-tRNA synthetase|nr:histidine--tRNA ligase [Candidatus Nomurabacteria bacterium]
MQKVNTAPLSGFMELLPTDQMVFDQIKQVISDVHHANGFLSVDLPLIYREEILLAKAGGDTEKQIYQLQKGDNKLALRFDHTVPLAAYIAENQNDLVFPFKVSNIGKNYRGERSQRGRYREFYQCDCDVIGRGELSIAYDAEVIGVIYEIYKKLNFGEFTLRVSNRKLLNGFLTSLNLQNILAVSHVIDGAEKISEAELIRQFQLLNITKEMIAKIVQFINISGTNSEVLSKLKALEIDNADFVAGLSELETVMDLLAKKGVDNAKIDLMIVRGLDYYTGTVYETILNDYPEIGSISSGGRYDNLTDSYTNERFQGVGASIGLTRLFYVLQENGIVTTERTSPVDVLLVPFSRKQFEYCYILSDTIKNAGKTVDIFLADDKLGKKLSYANKAHVKNVIVVGENEVENGNVMVKNMDNGELSTLDEYLNN